MRRSNGVNVDQTTNVAELRRDFHRFPELGFMEFRTAARIVEHLESLGYAIAQGDAAIDISACLGVPPIGTLEAAAERALAEGVASDVIAAMRGGKTAVIGSRTLSKSNPTPVLAFRFDMDGLPVRESIARGHLPAEIGFASVHGGEMHACGHDGHCAIGLELARLLAHAEGLRGTVKLIFQPAEEGCRGAAGIVRRGIVDDVDYLVCLHLGLGLPTGVVSGTCTGNLATSKFEVRFSGRSAHAGLAPEKGRHAILAAATAAIHMHGLPQFGGSVTRVNVGVIEGGTATNVIPDSCRLMVETRADSHEIHNQLGDAIQRVANGAALTYDLKCELSHLGEATVLHCDRDLGELACEAASSVEGVQRTVKSHYTPGSEDASLLMESVQRHGGKATYLVIGSDIPSAHHTNCFDLDEASLEIGAGVLEQVTRRLLEDTHQ